MGLECFGFRVFGVWGFGGLGFSINNWDGDFFVLILLGGGGGGGGGILLTMAIAGS